MPFFMKKDIILFKFVLLWLLEFSGICSIKLKHVTINKATDFDVT